MTVEEGFARLYDLYRGELRRYNRERRERAHLPHAHAIATRGARQAAKQALWYRPTAMRLRHG